MIYTDFSQAFHALLDLVLLLATGSRGGEFSTIKGVTRELFRHSNQRIVNRKDGSAAILIFSTFIEEKE